MEFNDNDIVKAVLAGEQNEFEKLVIKYQKAIVNYICNMTKDYQTALDLSQDVFIKTYESLVSFDPQFKFSTWLYRIASNHTIDYFRKKKVPALSFDAPIQLKDGEIETDFGSDNITPLDDLRNKELGMALEKALGQISEEYRELIVMRHINGLSYNEIADVKNIPLGTVKTRIFRARRELLKLMEYIL